VSGRPANAGITSSGVGPAVALLVGWWVVAALTALGLARLAPGTDSTTGALVATILLTALAVTVAVRRRHRPGHDPASLGLTPPRGWRRPALVALPVVLALTSLAGGVAWDLTASAFCLLVVGYVLTGFTEELLWRGTVLQLLRPLGERPAALLGSLLFGAAHLTNVLFRDGAPLVLAQAVGAFCFGVGYAALRLRTGALWPLMVAHLLTDLLPHVGRWPAIPVFVAQDVVLLVVGVVLLRAPRAAGGGRRAPGSARFAVGDGLVARAPGRWAGSSAERSPAPGVGGRT
jgi:membrane protease YdiL (CAAX protease family)